MSGGDRFTSILFTGPVDLEVPELEDELDKWREAIALDELPPPPPTYSMLCDVSLQAFIDFKGIYFSQVRPTSFDRGFKQVLSRRSFARRFPRARTITSLLNGIFHQELGAIIMLKAMGLSLHQIAGIQGIHLSVPSLCRRLNRLSPYDLPPIFDDSLLARLKDRKTGVLPPEVILSLAVWRYGLYTFPQSAKIMTSDHLAIMQLTGARMGRLYELVQIGGAIEKAFPLLSVADNEGLRRVGEWLSTKYAKEMGEKNIHATR
jgi:hypothetical protein